LKRIHITLALIFALCFMFAGCDLELEDKTVAVSGNLAYYAEMDQDTRKEKCEGNYIEVSGAVDIVYENLGTIYLGDTFKDKVQFSCKLSNSGDASNIEKDDIVTVRGKCRSCIASTIYLEDCSVEINTNLTESETTAHTNETSSTPTTETPTEPSKEPTTPPAETEPTTPSHSHSYANATCTTPKTCACGATEGSAKGHNWSAATCSKPKTCSVCGATDGAAKQHSWLDATYAAPKTCSNCGATEGRSLEKPGEENYHGHVYTGGQYSKKFHYEEDCAGSNSHEITWEEVDDRDLDPCGTCVLK